MASPIELPVLLTQLPLLQKIQSAQQRSPEAFQGQLAQEVLLKQKEARNQVPKTEKTDSGPKVGPDGEGSRGDGNSGRKEREQSEQTEARAEDGKDQGRIIDITI